MAELSSLSFLWLVNNSLASGVPASFQKLTELATLGLIGNSIETVPESTFLLTSIRYLDLSKNRLVELPRSIDRLINLERLDLQGNALDVLPDTVRNLKKLEMLELGNNRFEAVPDVLYDVESLKELSLENEIRLGDYWGPNKNAIRELSPRILRLENLAHISVDTGVIKTPPPEIVSNGIQAIREYFRQLEDRGTDHLYEAKLLIVGEGGAGKTTLANELLDPGYALRDGETTRGIDVLRWDFPWTGGVDFA
jgi:internalin A